MKRRRNNLAPAHIGLNAHLLSLSQDYRRAGINQYIYNLLLHLPDADNAHRYTAFLEDRRFADRSPPSLQLRFSRLPTVRPIVRILWEQFIQPVELYREKVDLLHAMAFAGPVISTCPSVVTVYDLSFLRFPERFPSAKRLYLSYFTHLSVNKAQRVIAISTSTKKDLTQFFELSPMQVDIAYPGVDDRFRPLPPEEVEDFRERRELPSQFILFLGTLEPRKNVNTLIRAYAQLAQKDIFPHKLVIAGAKGWFYERTFALIEELGLKDHVLLSGFVPAAQLPLWYNAADLFVYPSLYEGFGLPPLEAMACGTPVITSNAASLPEVIGDAGLLVEPKDVDGLTQMIASVLRSKGTQAELRQRGFRQAANFSWSNTARQVIKTYNRALEGKGAQTLNCEEVRHA